MQPFNSSNSNSFHQTKRFIKNNVDNVVDYKLIVEEFKNQLNIIKPIVSISDNISAGNPHHQKLQKCGRKNSIENNINFQYLENYNNTDNNILTLNQNNETKTDNEFEFESDEDNDNDNNENDNYNDNDNDNYNNDDSQSLSSSSSQLYSFRVMGINNNNNITAPIESNQKIINKDQEQRFFIINELINTEHQYITQLYFTLNEVILIIKTKM